MKTFVAVAALLAASLVVPSVSVQAASMASAPRDGCLVAPLLRAECREMIRAKAAEHKLPVLWWACTPAPKGSKYLLSCN